MREAPSRTLLESLVGRGRQGARLRSGCAGRNASHLWRPSGPALVQSATEALQGADALAIVTEWQEFRSPDFDLIAPQLQRKSFSTGAILYDPAFVKRFGLKYYAIGRGDSVC